MGGVLREDVAANILGWRDFGMAIAAFVILLIIRYICIFLFYPCLSRLGYGFTFNEAVLVSYGGLRGAVGLALAMVVHNDKALEAKRGKEVGAVVLLFTSIVALLTLIVNAPSTKYLVDYLGLAKQTEL